MMAAWMLHATWIAALLGFGASLLDWALSAYRRPARSAWTLAMLVAAASTILVPVLSRMTVVPAASPLAVAASSGTELPGLWASLRAALESPVDRFGLTSERLTALDLPLLVAWIASSLALLVVLMLSQRRLWRDRSGWKIAAYAGTSVRISPDLGPAVIGCWRPEIVIPAWALGLDDASKTLVARHEMEHVRAGDQRLLAIGVASVVVAPWNPLLWWMLQRLRLAIEIDCDRRSIGPDNPVRDYAELLIELGARVRPAGIPVAAIAEGRSMLVRRIRSFTGTVPRGRGPRALAAVGCMLVIVATVAATRLPASSQVVYGTYRLEEQAVPPESAARGAVLRVVEVTSSGDSTPAREGTSRASFARPQRTSGARGAGGRVIRATSVARPRPDSAGSTTRR
jgi:beta-lactamase regulating signal transducer with metallopeptidase domain